MKCMRIETARGHRAIVLIEDVDMIVGDDGYLRMQTPWGANTYKLVPFEQVVVINAGFSPRTEEEL
jgi:hypothetical protein